MLKHMLNKVMLIGNLTRKPVTRTTQEGKKLATFTVAINRNVHRKDDIGFDQVVDFVPIIVWDRQADLTESYLDKGDKVYLEGYLKIERPNVQGWKLPATAVMVAKKLVMLGEGSKRTEPLKPGEEEPVVEEIPVDEYYPEDFPMR